MRSFWFAALVIAALSLPACSEKSIGNVAPVTPVTSGGSFHVTADCSNHHCIHCPAFRIDPNHARIKVNTQIVLTAEAGRLELNACIEMPVAVVWQSSGGTLQVIDGGKQAAFSSSTRGRYTVTAIREDYAPRHAHVYVGF